MNSSNIWWKSTAVCIHAKIKIGSCFCKMQMTHLANSFIARKSNGIYNKADPIGSISVYQKLLLGFSI